MKPRFDWENVRGSRRPHIPRPYRPSAKEMMADSKLTWGEVTLYLVLTVAVVMAFAEHGRVLHGFMHRLPEFVTVVAHLLRNLV
ncbi:MAG TPA: hypothetical protein PLX89_19370 [Verrucomicrobiota bacterium]|nr:hypothetical protein [Verrucomicrobiota bacterium]